MSQDSFREVSSESWGGRLGKAVGGVLVGGVLVLVSFPLLFWNEGRAVQTARSLDEGAKAVVSVDAGRVEPANEGKLVHLTSPAKTEGTLADPEFGVSANAIRLRRVVEMYQWQEKRQTKKKKKLGGGEVTETVYSYEQVWSDKLEDSSGFRYPKDHHNPDRKPFDDQTWEAERVTVGAFQLSPGLIRQIRNEEPVPVDAAAVDRLPETLRGRFKVAEGRFYQGKDPHEPEIGDVRIEFKVVKPTTVSLVAQQANNTFEPYHAQAGDAIELPGKCSRWPRPGTL